MLTKLLLGFFYSLALLHLTAQAPAPAAGKSRVAVAAASDLVFCLDALNEKFKTVHTNADIKVSIGASGNFFAQIQRGAPFDVFLSADLSFPEKLVQAGAADGASLFTYAHGHLVLWTTRTNLMVTNGLTELLRSDVRRIAIANPDTAPYGRAAKAALEHAKLWEAVKPKLVIGENIAQTAQFVEQGAADAGIVALSLVSAPKLAKVGRWWAVPPELHPPVIQGAVLTKAGSTNAVARAFLDFLRSPDARDIFHRFGFRLPESSPP